MMNVPPGQPGQGGDQPAQPGADQMAMQGAMPQMQQNADVPQEDEAEEAEDANRKDIPKQLLGYIESKNIAENLDEEKLKEIGRVVYQNTILDDDSRQDWKDQNEKALEIAKQIYKKKTFPWPGAANVKYPLLLTACLQFNARSFPNIIQNNKVVYVDIMRPEPTPEQEASAERIGNHMSYQLIGVDDRWLDDKDKLLMILPLAGICFTKTYFNEIDRMPETDLCLPEDIIINQQTKSLEKAQRVTHALYFNNNDLISRMRSDLYLDIPMEDLSGSDVDNERVSEDEFSTTTEEGEAELEINDSKIHLLYEQHCYLDLDDDDYAEPYIVTVHAASQKVLRIVARYNYSSFVFEKNEDDAKSKKKKEFIKIKPIQYFTVYRLMHAPDGGFYGMGFGQILYPLNHSVNTILNQLIDAGTLSNQQSGFIGKSLRLRKRKVKLKPGEWELIDNANGADISRNIVPIPTKEPSAVLFQLLGMIIEAAQSVANINDVMQGQMPPANTPATTVVSLIEQGTKVFSSILLRLYNSLKNEYQKRYDLNRRYLTKETNYRSAIGTGFITPEDYTQNDFGIFPVADPRESIEAQALARAQALMNILGDPAVNQREILTRYLKALKIPHIEKILPEPDPNAPPPPEAQKLMAETDLIKGKHGEILANMERDAIRLDIEEKQLILNAEDIASVAASRKVASITEMTELEQTADQQQIEQAAQMEEGLEPQLMQLLTGLQNRINFLEQQAGIPPQTQQMAQGQPPQQAGIPPRAAGAAMGAPGAPTGIQPGAQGMPGGAGDLGSSLEDKMEAASPGAAIAPEPRPE